MRDDVLLRLTYTIDKADREDAESLQVRRQLGGGSRVVTWLTVAAAAALLGWRFYTEISPRAAWPIWVGVFAVVWVVAFIVVRRRAAAVGASAVTLDVAEDGLHLVEPNGVDVRLPWAGVADFAESPRLFVLFSRDRTLAYLVPKRAFDGHADEWRQWFRDKLLLASTALVSAPPAAAGAPATSDGAGPEGDVAEYALTLADRVDLARAAWVPRVMAVAGVGLVVGPLVHVLLTPAPDAVNGPLALVLVTLPMVVLFGLMGPAMYVVHGWMSSPDRGVRYRVTVGPQGMTQAGGRDGASTSIRWDAFSRYKETRRAFYLWRPWQRAALILPKRAFADRAAVDRVRGHVAAQMQRSTWLIG
jgi:hypothetical protein